MIRKSVLLAMALFLCYLPVYSTIKALSVISDMKDYPNLIDGSQSTSAVGKAGDNSCIFQFGNLKYIKSVVLYYKTKVKIKNTALYVSDDFINWTLIKEVKNTESEKVTIEDLGAKTSFLKIVITAESDFLLSETEFDEGVVPKNLIENVRVESVEESSVVIKWQTSEKSQDYLVYAKKHNGVSESMVDVRFITDHVIQIRKLLKGTEYQYKIVSETADGKRIESPVGEFTTRGIPLPDLWELTARNITPFGARIFYKSNIPTSYEVFLGRNEKDLNRVISVSNFSDTNEFDLRGLQPETAYFYRLFAKDAYGNVISTPPLSFITPANNIALGKKVGGTFNYVDEDIKKRGFGDSTMEKVVDGNLNYYGGMALSYNTDNADQYVIIDLGAKEPIRRVEIYWWGLSYSRNYNIDLSFDGATWTTVVAGLDAENGKEVRSPAGDLLCFQTVPLGKEARFVRLFVKAGTKKGTKVKKWDPKPNLYLCEIAVIRDDK